MKLFRIVKQLFILGLFTFCVGIANGQRLQSFLLQPLTKTDSLAKLFEFSNTKTTVEEREKHKLIWKLEVVRKGATSLKEKGIETFTMTDQKPAKDHPYYEIGFYEILEEHYTRLMTYRISKDLTIESYNFIDNVWTVVK